LNILKEHSENRYWFEQGMLSEAAVEVKGSIVSDDCHKAFRDLLTYADARNLIPKTNNCPKIKLIFEFFLILIAFLL
jgi:hypothetical protein